MLEGSKVTPTGRLDDDRPDQQGIPPRTDEFRRIREVLVKESALGSREDASSQVPEPRHRRVVPR